MLKRESIVAIAAVLLSVGKLHALPVGNPIDASLLTEGICWEGHYCQDPCDPCINWCDAWSIRFGFYGDYVFNRHLEVSKQDDHSNIRSTELYTNAGYLILNFYDRIDFFTTLGESKVRVETPRSTFTAPNATNTTNLNSVFESEWYFSWSVGARATLWECGCFEIGAETQYFYTRPRIKYFETDNFDTFYLDSRMTYWEYQFGIGVTYTIGFSCGTFVVPYVAVKWARAQLDAGNFRINQGASDSWELFELENRNTTGLAIGTTLVGCRMWSITAEGRFFDEIAFHLNSQIRY